MGKYVVPKLNWSCPVDAKWVSTNDQLGCSNADEILLLLKCSDRIASDLE